MKIYFDKKELETFNIEELKKMLNVQIKGEKFEGASVIRDILNDRKKDFNFGEEQDDDNDDDKTKLL